MEPKIEIFKRNVFTSHRTSFICSKKSPFFQIISHILAYSNSCVNPILYAFLSEPFRRGFWSIITCIRPSGPHGIQHNGYELTEVKTRKEGKKIFHKLLAIFL